MKKVFAILIGFILITVILVSGCGETTTSTTATTSSPTAAVTPTTVGPVPQPTGSATATPTQTAEPTTTGPQKYGGILRFAADTSPAGAIGWPPDFSGGATGSFVQFALEPLLRIIDREFVPALATSWELAQDKSSITFGLRKGVKFHDGTDFDAQAVKFNYDHLIANKVRVAKNWTSVDVVDDYTIRVNLSRFTNVMYQDFTSSSGSIVSPTAYEKNGVEWMRENMVGTGPFILESYTHDVNAIFKRNPNYWMEGKPYLDGVEVVWFAERMTAGAALEAGEVDALQTGTGSMAASLIEKKFTVESAVDGVKILLFDGANEDSPFHDKMVGQAVDYAIDKEAIVKAKGYGFWIPAYQWPLIGFSTYDPNYPSRRYDVDKAKQLLADAGYPNGFPYRLIANPMGYDPDVCVAIQNFLGKVGIDVTIETPAYSKFVEYRNVNPWSGAMIYAPMGMSGGMNKFFEGYMLSSSGVYKSMYRPPELDQMIEDSLLTVVDDPVKIKAIADYIYDLAMLIPLYETGQAAMYNGNKVHDAHFLSGAATSLWSPWDVWLSE